MKRVLTAVVGIASVSVLAACGSGPAPGGGAGAGSGVASSPWGSPRSGRRVDGVPPTRSPSRRRPRRPTST